MPFLLLHAGRPLEPHDLWTAWSTDLLVWVSLVTGAAMYWVGARRLWRRAGEGHGVSRAQARVFAGGMAALAFALLSPLDALGSVLFSAHMLQHVILMLVAAPLLVLGAPGIAMIWALPRPARHRVGTALRHPSVRRTWRTLRHPVTAWTLFAVATWAWHAPGLYQATLRSDAVHALQHASFLGSALLFWWVLAHRGHAGRTAYGIGVLYLFTTALHSSLLGALLTFATSLWYPVYATTARLWGLSPLEDQQLAGAIMWIPAGTVFVVAALACFAAWMRALDAPAALRSSVPSSG